MNNRRSQSLFGIYRWPLALSLLIAAGIGAALQGSAPAWLFAWLVLGIPLAVIIGFLASGRKKSSSQD
jgi:hypothetical protein